MQNKELLRDKIEKETAPADTAELPRRSHCEDFRLTLQLIGIVLVVLGVIWGIEYWKSG
jgi:hypothetical protein